MTKGEGSYVALRWCDGVGHTYNLINQTIMKRREYAFDDNETATASLFESDGIDEFDGDLKAAESVFTATGMKQKLEQQVAKLEGDKKKAQGRCANLAQKITSDLENLHKLDP